MKTENKNMRIMEPGNTTEEREAKGTKYKPVQPVVLDTIPEDAVFIRSTDVCKLDFPIQQRRNHELPGI